jgi:hypothetical protein
MQKIGLRSANAVASPGSPLANLHTQPVSATIPNHVKDKTVPLTHY